ncbi:MAG: hypothetical protein RSD00_03360 [Bacilli bacterium]
MKRHKISALLGVVIMGISAFIACTSEVTAIICTGNMGILFSIGIMAYGFTHWKP